MNAENYFNFSNTPLIIERCVVWHVVHSPPPSYIANNIAVCVVNVILAIAGTILNLLVVVCLWNSVRLRSKLSYFTIMVLSSTDLAVVAVSHPLFAYKLMSGVLGTPSCLYELSYFLVFSQLGGMAFESLFITHIERYLAILHPLWHRVKVTKRRFLSLCICIWVFQLGITAGNFFSWFVRGVVIPIVSCSVFVTTLFVYVSIFLASRKRLSKRSTEDVTNSQETPSKLMKLLRELKTAKALFFVVVLTFVCYVPAGVFLWRQESWYKNGNAHVNLWEVYGWTWVLTLAMTMSSLNCLVFFWSNRELRKEVFKVLERWFRPSQDR